MTFLRLEALNKHWGKNPPVNVMVRSLCGYKSGDPAQVQDGAEFFSQLG